jgi:uncharacterized membrane protein
MWWVVRRRPRLATPRSPRDRATVSTSEPDESPRGTTTEDGDEAVPSSWVQRLLDPSRTVVREARGHVVPAWRRATKGEPRLPVSVAILVAIGLQAALPNRVADQPRWLLPGLAALLLIGIVAANPTHVNRRSPALRATTLLLIVFMSAANIASAARLVVDLVRSQGLKDPTELLLTGLAIWLTNVIVFALWYWEFDRGGPVARALAPRPYPDFLFPQMTTPELAPEHWEPGFVDYLYMSFTNATAFSPTDVMPMSRWAKLTMLVQSAISLITVALVIARAVNILK